MRIVVACDWFLKYASEQAAALARAGHDVALLHRGPLEEFGGRRAEQDHCLDIARAAGVRVCTIDGENRSLRAARSAWRVRRWLARFRPELIHIHPNGDLWLALVLTPKVPGRSRVPLVLTVHDPSPHPGHQCETGLRGWIDRAWLRWADGFVVHGAELQRLWEPRAGDRPTWVVPHGVRMADVPLPVPSSASLLLFGRLEPYKGIAVLMEAMALVWAERPDIRLVVAGTGQSEREVIEHPNVERLFRYIAEDELPDLFATASLVLAPYTEASQSGVVSLAVGQGIPVIVSDQGSLAELAVFDDAIVPAGDPRALATAILRFAEHSIEQRHRVLEATRRTFSWDATARTVTPFYARLVAGAPAPELRAA